MSWILAITSIGTHQMLHLYQQCKFTLYLYMYTHTLAHALLHRYSVARCDE